jgi:cytochrome c oxidase subunit II
MSMPSRSRSGSGALVAGLIILVTLVVAIAILAAAGVTPQALWDSFFPVQGQTPVTDRSLATKALYDLVFYIAAAIFVLVEVLIVWTVFRYRRKPGDDSLPPQTHGNNLVEVIWTAVPTAIVLFLFAMSYQALTKVDAQVTPEVQVRAVASRFQWQFDYLDASGQDVLFSQQLPVGEDGGLVLPVGEPVKITLISKDVIHAFYVPKFLFKRDVVPGKENNFEFTVEEAGTYRGQCAELCGPYHGSMIFDVHAKPKAEFDAWLKTQIEKPHPTQGAVSSAAPTGTTVDLGAKNVAYTTGALQAPAGAAFTIRFKNDDAGIPHNVEIKDASGAQVFKGDIITGVANIDYAVPALAAGTYTFACTVHPNMTGTLTVQ